jgi:putative membrane protein
MQIFLWIVFFILVGIAIFTIQNSNAAPVLIKFLLWKFETSLVYTILGSIVLGILVSMFLWISRTIRLSYKRKSQRREENLKMRNLKLKDDR